MGCEVFAQDIFRDVFAINELFTVDILTKHVKGGNLITELALGLREC